ncbi:MAG: hypothetical protein OXU71_02530, partial [Gammaproteobacteria bacterium]|nr:hypothetical protein [Gammaproteobacteria bacterium]
ARNNFGARAAAAKCAAFTMLDSRPRLLLFALEVAADAFAVFDAPPARIVLTGSVIVYLRWKLNEK